MPAIHREDDFRECGATTIVSNQSTVKIGGKLVAVTGDENSHGGGEFVDSGRSIKIGGLTVIAVGDEALLDDAGHTPLETLAGTGSTKVFVGD